MRPLGFEAPAKRLERSLMAGLLAGAAFSAVTACAVLAKRPERPASLLLVTGAGFAMGFMTGFSLSMMRPEFAPAQQRDDGDTTAGAPARVKPPRPTLSEKADLKTDDPHA